MAHLHLTPLIPPAYSYFISLFLLSIVSFLCKNLRRRVFCWAREVITMLSIWFLKLLYFLILHMLRFISYTITLLTQDLYLIIKIRLTIRIIFFCRLHNCQLFSVENFIDCSLPYSPTSWIQALSGHLLNLEASYFPCFQYAFNSDYLTKHFLFGVFYPYLLQKYSTQVLFTFIFACVYLLRNCASDLT